jgi:chain length determinant protein EpsF
MNLFQLLATLRARWLTIVLVTMVGLIASVVFVVTRPIAYMATATIVLDAKSDPVSSMLYGGAVSPALINTQLEVMRSERVAQRVVKNMKLAEMADMKAKWTDSTDGSGSFEAWIADSLIRGLQVRLSAPGSTVIEINYQSTEARFAAAMANAFVQAYMETAIELRIDPALQYNSFFENQVRDAREALEAAQQRLSKFQQDKGLLVADGRYDIETARLASLSESLVAVQSLSMSTKGRLAQVNRDADRMSEVLTSGQVNNLKNELQRAEAKLAELNSRFGENHPAVAEAKAAASDLKTRLAAETRNVAGSISAEARVSSGKEEELKASLEAQRLKVLQLKEVRDQGEVLARDVENAKRSYDMLFTRYNQTNIESQNRLSAATVLSQAETPTRPSSKAAWIVLVVGFLLSSVTGIAAALVMEQLDPRARTTEITGLAMGLPVIGVMPRPNVTKLAKRKLALIQQRVISGRQLPPPIKP